MTRYLLALVVALGIAAPATAHAQWRNPYTGTNWNNPMSSLADTMLYNSMQRQMLQASLNAQNKKKAAAAAAATHAPAATLDFKPAPGHPAVKAFLDGANLPADQRAAFQQVIDATFTEVEKRLRKNNLATGMGVALAAALEIKSGQEVPEDRVDELWASINDMLVASPEVKKLKPDQMQTMYDSLIMTTAIMLTFHELGKSDPKMKQASVDFASNVLATLTGSKSGS